MNKFVRFYIDRLLILTLLPLITAIVATVYVSQEITPAIYTSYAEAYPHLSAQSKAAIRSAMANGKITRWDSAKLTRMVFDETSVLAICVDSGKCQSNSVVEARQRLQSLLKQ